jgi:hypothetical protein
MNDLIEIQAELKQLHQEFLNYAEKIKDVSRRLGLLVKDSDNVILKWQVHHHWLNNVDRKFKILDEELDNEIAAPFSALPPVTASPIYKDLTLKIEAFRLLNPDMDESEAQKRISKIVKEHVQNRRHKQETEE